jgi:hypothetical protein
MFILKLFLGHLHHFSGDVHISRRSQLWKFLDRGGIWLDLKRGSRE